MVDLKGQYEKIKEEIDHAILDCVRSTAFINGPQVATFANATEKYLGCNTVIPCANGTDALQIAMMALGLVPGDEVIVPAFTYVATAEVIGLLGLVPVMVDVDAATFCISPDEIERAITPRTKAIVPVHLYGQCANMAVINDIAARHGLFVIEDTAQAFGADFISPADSSKVKAGTLGHIGCTSFFPSKNLGCYGDGGAMYTNDPEIGQRLKMIANHGQQKKYVHKVIGVNSRLDSLQAAILNVKLAHLDEYAAARQAAASYYDARLGDVEGIRIPVRASYSSHVFHQYTIIIDDGRRDHLKAYLEQHGIPSMIYYPIPLNEQEAYQSIGKVIGDLPVTKQLCNSVLSLPMHTELTADVQDHIIGTIKNFM